LIVCVCVCLWVSVCICKNICEYRECASISLTHATQCGGDVVGMTMMQRAFSGGALVSLALMDSLRLVCVSGGVCLVFFLSRTVCVRWCHMVMVKWWATSATLSASACVCCSKVKSKRRGRGGGHSSVSRVERGKPTQIQKRLRLGCD
jgi:hypothetical protein